MNHKIKGRKFNRSSSHRKSMFSNLCKALISHEQIVTTVHKAKDVRPIVEKLITLGKRKDLHARRQAIQFLGDGAEVAKLFDTMSSRYEARNGGYTRIIKIGNRKGDNAPMAVIEFLERDIEAKGA